MLLLLALLANTVASKTPTPTIPVTALPRLHIVHVAPVVETTSPMAIIITILLGFIGLVFITCDVNTRKKRHAEVVRVVYNA